MRVFIDAVDIAVIGINVVADSAADVAVIGINVVADGAVDVAFIAIAAAATVAVATGWRERGSVGALGWS